MVNFVKISQIVILLYMNDLYVIIYLFYQIIISFFIIQFLWWIMQLLLLKTYENTEMFHC